MNVKPGDLAIMIKAALPENIGSIVVVIRPGIMREYGPEWICESTNTSRGVSDFGHSLVIQKGDEFDCPDSWLRPVSGLPDQQHTEEHNELEA